MRVNNIIIETKKVTHSDSGKNIEVTFDTVLSDITSVENTKVFGMLEYEDGVYSAGKNIAMLAVQI